ncbi:MAG: putative phage abortive infection protein [Prevotella sp.]|nr:putative phage abortive infection protein [Prevotella sp.]
MKVYKMSKHGKIALCAMSAVLLLLLFSWLCIDYYIPDPQSRGTFGDKFGAVNSLFSGLAFAGLIYTIYLQQEELRLQREELQQTRQEMNRQTREFDEQNKTLQIQRFENTFFNMMGLLQDVLHGLSINTSRPNMSKSRDFSGRIHRDWQQESITLTGRQVFEETYSGTGICLTNLIKAKGIEGYNESNAISLYDHYFRLLYRIMKFVDTSSALSDHEIRYQYMAMLRSQLSRYELIWLYYNGLSNNGYEKLKPLIEKYSMLKNIRQELIVDTDLPVGEYSPSAFGIQS